MNYLDMKLRVSENIDKENIESLIADWINEKREEISTLSIAYGFPLGFLLTTKTINLSESTYSYNFDKGESTGRYGGKHSSVSYYNGISSNVLDYAEYDFFDNLYPVQEVGDPTAYTVRGGTFYLNKIPASVSGKKFTVQYFSLPDILTLDSDEHYIDNKFHKTIVDFVCAEAMDYLLEDSARVAYWQGRAQRGLESMISVASGVDITKVRARMYPSKDE